MKNKVHPVDVLPESGINGFSKVCNITINNEGET
jgi:hypothetical protein